MCFVELQRRRVRREDVLGKRSEIDPYGNLDPDRIVFTVERLGLRIGERFPDAGLWKVCQRLEVIARQARWRAQRIARPIYALRVLNGFLMGLIVASLALSVSAIDLAGTRLGLGELVQVLEAGINNVVFIGVALFFMVSLEGRIKRGRALKAMHELRSIAHIIDMHQLTKDPDRILRIGPRTKSSPELNMTPFELGRYLDYATEMLSLVGKIAALYVERFDDPQAVAAVNEIETLTTGLSRKIWQKLMALYEAAPEAKEPTAA